MKKKIKKLTKNRILFNLNFQSIVKIKMKKIMIILLGTLILAHFSSSKICDIKSLTKLIPIFFFNFSNNKNFQLIKQKINN